jgi:hypothetical protein
LLTLVIRVWTLIAPAATASLTVAIRRLGKAIHFETRILLMQGGFQN